MRTLRALAILVAVCLSPSRLPAQAKPQAFTPQDILNIVRSSFLGASPCFHLTVRGSPTPPKTHR